VGGLVDARGQEALELAARLVEHTDGRVPGGGQLAGGGQNGVEHHLDIELREYALGHVQHRTYLCAGPLLRFLCQRSLHAPVGLLWCPH
jgi:hypothetical protein